MILRTDTPQHQVKRIAKIYYYKRNLSAFRYKLLYRRVLVKETRRQLAEYLRAFRRVNPETKRLKLSTKALLPDINLEDNIKRLITLLLPIYQANVAGSARDALILAGLSSVDFVPNTPAIQSFMRARTLATSTLYNSGTDARVRQSLITGINQGESIRNLEKRITRVYKQAEGYRAERIARTESIRATNFASVESWKQSGGVTSKQWSAVIDDRTADVCLQFHGLTIPLGNTFLEKDKTIEVPTPGDDPNDTFTNTFEDVEHPPLFPNCRCTLLPVSD